MLFYLRLITVKGDWFLPEKGGFFSPFSPQVGIHGNHLMDILYYSSFIPIWGGGMFFDTSCDKMHSLRKKQ